MIAAASKIDIVDGGAPKLSTDSAKLLEKAQPAIAKLDLKGAKDASYKKDGDTLTVVPSVDGSEVGKDNFEKAVMPAIPSTERSVKLELTGAKAKFTTEQAEQQKPKQVIGGVHHQVPARRLPQHQPGPGRAADQRQHRRDQRRVLPGQGARSAHLEQRVRRRHRDRRREAGGADSRRHLPERDHRVQRGLVRRAGGHRAPAAHDVLRPVPGGPGVDHLLRVDRREVPQHHRQCDLHRGVPAGLQPGHPGSITVRIWGGTKKWDIESPEPVKSDYYNTSEEIKGSGPSCIAQSAQPGFTASYYRVFKVNGSVVKREDKSWKYDAVAKVTCN